MNGIKGDYDHEPIPDSDSNSPQRNNNQQTLKSELKNVNEKMLFSQTPKDQRGAKDTLRPEKQVKSAVEKLDFSCLAYILPQCCFSKNSRTRRHLELHSKFRKVIDLQMDVMTILTKLHLIDKVNYILCGNEKKNLLQTSMNPYLYKGDDLPAGCDIYNARSQIIKGFKRPVVKKD